VITVNDPNVIRFRLNVKQEDGSFKQEQYSAFSALMVIGNLFIGDRYCEPQGNARITNEQTGEFAEIDFKTRSSWNTKKEDINFVSATIKTKEGVPKLKLYGKYTDRIMATDLETNEEFEVSNAPVFPKPP
jgi:hypothetical protein